MYLSFEIHLVSVLDLKMDPESPEREIQTGLDCVYEGLSEVILSFTHCFSRVLNRIVVL